MDEFNKALKAYEQKWHALTTGRNNEAFFAALKPTAFGWKTKDISEFNAWHNKLRDLSDQIHLGWVNERWLATFHLKGDPMHLDMRVIKIMQRRPQSTDAIGLDHVDFYTPDISAAEELLKKEDLKWTRETNGDHCKWLSVWFDGTEAKVRTDTVLRVCSDELIETENRILE